VKRGSFISSYIRLIFEPYFLKRSSFQEILVVLEINHTIKKGIILEPLSLKGGLEVRVNFPLHSVVHSFVLLTFGSYSYMYLILRQ
jgi:hypothetical protein